jgi:hypothetical protein
VNPTFKAVSETSPMPRSRSLMLTLTLTLTLTLKWLPAPRNHTPAALARSRLESSCRILG